MDIDKAKELYEHSCKELDFNESCLALGNLYLTNKSKWFNFSWGLHLDNFVSNCVTNCEKLQYLFSFKRHSLKEHIIHFIVASKKMKISVQFLGIRCNLNKG